MTTSYFTFGHDHVHETLGRRFGERTIVRVTAPDPRAVMLGLFGRAWAFEYSEEQGPLEAAKWGYEVVEITGTPAAAQAGQDAPQTPVDGMGNIERWEVWECPTNGHTFAYPSGPEHAYPKWCPGCGTSLVHRDGRIAEVSYRGAVEALREIDKRAASRAEDNDMRHVSQLAAIQSVARRAIGGQ